MGLAAIIGVWVALTLRLTSCTGASSSYIMFSTLERPKVMAENPGMTVTDCSRELGTRWKTLTADEKAPYEERARADKER